MLDDTARTAAALQLDALGAMAIHWNPARRGCPREQALSLRVYGDMFCGGGRHDAELCGMLDNRRR